MLILFYHRKSSIYISSVSLKSPMNEHLNHFKKLARRHRYYNVFFYVFAIKPIIIIIIIIIIINCKN